MSAPNIFNTFLKNSGSSDMAVDGSTPVTFSLSHATRTMVVVRLIVHVEDTGNFTDTTYGAIAALDPGCLLRVKSSTDTTTTDLLDGSTITGTYEWARFCYDVNLLTPSAGGKTLSVRWTFGKYAGAAGGLILEPTDALEFVIQDNLSALTEHTIMAEGFYK